MYTGIGTGTLCPLATEFKVFVMHPLLSATAQSVTVAITCMVFGMLLFVGYGVHVYVHGKRGLRT